MVSRLEQIEQELEIKEWIKATGLPPPHLRGFVPRLDGDEIEPTEQQKKCMPWDYRRAREIKPKAVCHCHIENRHLFYPTYIRDVKEIVDEEM